MNLPRGIGPDASAESGWGVYIFYPLADAILDRLLHNSHKLKLKGESMRKALSKIADSDHLE